MYNTFENSANEFKTKNYNFPAPKSSGGDPTGESIIMIDEKIKNHDTKHTEKENELNTNIVETNKKLEKEIINRTNADVKINERIRKYHEGIIINVSEAYEWGEVAFNVYGSGDIVTICNIHTINNSNAKQNFSKKFEGLRGMIQTGIRSIVVLIKDNVQSCESLPVNIDNDTISFGVERGQMFGSSIVVQRRLE